MPQALSAARLSAVRHYHDEELKPEVDWAFSLPWLYYNDAPAIYTERDDVATSVQAS